MQCRKIKMQPKIVFDSSVLWIVNIADVTAEQTDRALSTGA